MPCSRHDLQARLYYSREISLLYEIVSRVLDKWLGQVLGIDRSCSNIRRVVVSCEACEATRLDT